MTPQALVYLAPDGSIKTELRGPNGSRRSVVIEDLDSLRRILSEQIYRYDPLIGEDGAPTQAQIVHWEEHSKRSIKTMLYSTCPFCRDYARAAQYDESLVHRVAKKSRKIRESLPTTIPDGY